MYEADSPELMAEALDVSFIGRVVEAAVFKPCSLEFRYVDELYQLRAYFDETEYGTEVRDSGPRVFLWK